jgi:hypothetical protein
MVVEAEERRARRIVLVVVMAIAHAQEGADQGLGAAAGTGAGTGAGLGALLVAGARRVVAAMGRTGEAAGADGDAIAQGVEEAHCRGVEALKL